MILVSILFKTFLLLIIKVCFGLVSCYEKSRYSTSVYQLDLQIDFLISFKIIGSLNSNPILDKRFKNQNTEKSI